MREVNSGHHLEQFTGNMISRTDAGRPHVDVGGIDFGIGDEFGDRLDRYRGIHLQEKGLAMNARDRGDVADQIEPELVVERGVDRVHRSGHKERISVRGRVHDRLSGDIAGRARPILDDKLLTEPLRQPLSYQACHDVGGASGGKSDNDAHRPRRIAFRPSDPRQGRQHGGTGCQMQKTSARKFHFEPPSNHSITSSARASSMGGTVSPSALAVLGLMASSNLVGVCSGRSAGFSPLRMRSTYWAAERNWLARSDPYDIRPPALTKWRQG